ncbi:TRAP transporter substrate-binding protein [Terrarubrum flagellatum]|uniref:TRAP transporter substrate-binding protein n=1 Tax=Terrirubrum flagellatum TaxID=2895980 RepID=UPI0031450E18
MIQWIVALVVAALAATTELRAQQAWRVINEYPASSLPGEADALFAKLVAERLGGKLSITPVPDAKSGLKSSEQVDAVAAGRFEMANSFGGALGGAGPWFLLSSLPFVTADAADAKALFEIAEARYHEMFAKRSQKLLYVSPWPASGVWSSAPLGGSEALKALRIRTFDATGTQLFGRIGAKAEIVSFADLEGKLASGEFNAVLSSGDGGAGRSLWRHLKYFSEIGYAVPLSFATVNLEKWNALDADARAEIERIGKEVSERQWAAMNGRVDANYVRMRDNGMSIAKPPVEVMQTLREAAADVLAKWTADAGGDGKALLAAYRARRGK